MFVGRHAASLALEPFDTRVSLGVALAVNALVGYLGFAAVAHWRDGKRAGPWAARSG